jgi:hypothetical protein
MNRFLVFGYAGLAAVGITAASMSWYNTRPADPAEITAAVSSLNADQRKEFDRYITGTMTTLDPKRIGQPIRRADLNDAIEFAKTDSAESRLRQSQEQAMDNAMRTADLIPRSPKP